VNAGTYLIDPAALAGWPAGRSISVEREIFPGVIEAGHPVFGFLADAYWLDLGTPEKYLQAHRDLLDGRVHGVTYPAPWISPDAAVDPGARLGRWVAVGAGATIGAGADLDDTVVHPDAKVGAEARIRSSVLGPASSVGAGATVEHSVLGERAVVPEGEVARDERISGSRGP
jgi:mannose-1-phosphate guanylyltransferase